MKSGGQGRDCKSFRALEYAYLTWQQHIKRGYSARSKGNTVLRRVVEMQKSALARNPEGNYASLRLMLGTRSCFLTFSRLLFLACASPFSLCRRSWVKATVVLRTLYQRRPSNPASQCVASTSLKKAKIAQGMYHPIVFSSMVIRRNSRFPRPLASSHAVRISRISIRDCSMN